MLYSRGISHKLKAVRYKKRVILVKSVQTEGKIFFSAQFFRETAVQFQIKYDELQNPKTCKHHYGGFFKR